MNPDDAAAIPLNEHSIRRSVLLHVFPGLVATAIYLFAAQREAGQGASIIYSLFPAIMFGILPIELGILAYLGLNRNERLSFDGIVTYRKPMSKVQFVVFTINLAVWGCVLPALPLPTHRARPDQYGVCLVAAVAVLPRRHSSSLTHVAGLSSLGPLRLSSTALSDRSWKKRTIAAICCRASNVLAYGRRCSTCCSMLSPTSICRGKYRGASWPSCLLCTCPGCSKMSTFPWPSRYLSVYSFRSLLPW